MKNVCCADCRYAFFEREYDGDDDWRDNCYCTAGTVLIGIKNPNEVHDCSFYWPTS